MERGRRIFNRILLSGFIITFFTCLEATGQAAYTSISIFEENGSKGIVTADGKEVIPAKYYDLGWTNGLPEFHENVMGYRESEKWGLINSNNKIITPPKYSQLYPAENSNLIVAALPGRFSGEKFFGIINASGKVVIPFMYAGVEVLGDVVIIKSLDGNRSKFGIVNMSNQPVLPFEYEMITSLNKDLIAVTKKDNKIALMNPRGKEAIRYEIDSLDSPENQYYRIYNEGKVGLINNEGTLILSPDYKKLDIEPAEGKISYLNFNQWNFLRIGSDSQPVILADELKDMGDGIYQVTLNSQTWLADRTLDILSLPFDGITQVSKSHFRSTKNKKYGLLNSIGHEVLSTDFDSLLIAGPFVYVSKNIGNKAEWKIYDTLGIQKNHFKYQEVQPVTEGLIPVKRNNKWGFMSREGVEMIHCVYDHVSPFERNKSVVTLHGEDGIINKEGNWVLFPGDKSITMINDTLLLEGTNYHTRLVTIDSDLIYFTENKLIWKGTYLEETVDSLTTWHISLKGTIINTDAGRNLAPILFYDSLLIIYQAEEAGVVSETGREVIPFGVWDEIYPPSQGFLGIMDDDFYGFVDIDNKLRIANRYEGIGPFIEGLAAVKVRGKWGFIDQRETLICQPLYTEVGEFQNGVCVVRIENKWGLIGNDGKLIQSMEFDSMEQLESGFLKTSTKNVFGLLDASGKTILFPKYEELEVLENDLVLVKRKGNYGLIDLNGVNVLPTSYPNLRYMPTIDAFLTSTPGVWETRTLPSLNQ